MAFVMRNAAGAITGLFEQLQEDRAEEYIPEDSPEAVAYVNQAPAFYRVSKTTPWLRMSSAEAEKVYAAMAGFDVRLRAIYDAAQFLQSNDPLWPTLESVLAGVLSPTRAKELLAPEA